MCLLVTNNSGIVEAWTAPRKDLKWKALQQNIQQNTSKKFSEQIVNNCVYFLLSQSEGLTLISIVTCNISIKLRILIDEMNKNVK